MKNLVFIANYLLLPVLLACIVGIALRDAEMPAVESIVLFSIIILIVGVVNILFQLLFSLFKMNHFPKWFLASSCSMLLIWFVFRTMHWPGATLSLFVSMAFFIAFISIWVLKKQSSKKE